MEETEGISFMEICRIILKKIWLIIAISVALGVICACAFWLKNKSITKYEFSFVLDFPGYEDGIYPDTTPFDYKDIIKDETVNTLKSKTEYKNINFDKVLDDISISRVTNKIKEGSNPIYEDVYTIKVSKNAIGNKKLAKSFLIDLANTPIEYAKNSINNYDYFQTSNLYDEAISYDFKIAYLTEEQQYLIDSYSALIEEYGEQVVDSNNKTIAFYKKQVESKALTDEINNLTKELNSKYYYIVDPSNAQTEINKFLIAIDNSLNKIKYYQNEKDDLINDINQLTSCIASIDANLSKITSLNTSKITEYQVIVEPSLKYISYIVAKTEVPAPSLTDLQTKYNDVLTNDSKNLQTLYNEISVTYNEQAETTFNNNLDAIKNKLAQYANTYREVMKDFINSNSYVQINGINAIGGTSPILGAVIGIIVGFIISSVVVYFVESVKEKKNVNKEKEIA